MSISLKFITLMLLAISIDGKIPSYLLGNWTVGAPYEFGQPIGLNADQEGKIIGLNITLAPDHIKVCGKDVPVKSIDVQKLTKADFLQRYRFLPSTIGLRGAVIVEVSINTFHSTNACGDFGDPGSSLFASNGHVVMETGNDYFPLKRK